MLNAVEVCKFLVLHHVASNPRGHDYISSKHRRKRKIRSHATQEKQANEMRDLEEQARADTQAHEAALKVVREKHDEEMDQQKEREHISKPSVEAISS